MMHYGYSKQHYIAYNKGTFFLNKMKKKKLKLKINVTNEINMM